MAAMIAPILPDSARAIIICGGPGAVTINVRLLLLFFTHHAVTRLKQSRQREPDAKTLISEQTYANSHKSRDPNTLNGVLKCKSSRKRAQDYSCLCQDRHTPARVGGVSGAISA